MAASAESPGKEKRSAGSGRSRGSSIQVVEFVLGDGLFAVDLFDVKEVVEYTTITKVPNVPPFVRGIIDLRGEITTIIDLKQRLNIEDGTGGPADSSRIMVLDDTITRNKIGILVDDVRSVSTFEPEMVDYSSASVSREASPVTGIIRRKVNVKDREKNELIIWIEIRKLLSDIDGEMT